MDTRLATIGDLEPLMHNPHVRVRNYSTVEEYHDAMTRKSQRDNAAGKNMDAGREPYLVSMEAVEFDMHPFIEVHDVMIEKNDDGLIGIDTAGPTHYVGRHTLLAWR